MRTVTYGAACTLDGFIAGGDGAVDWLHFSDDAQKAMGDYWSSIDTILMGRKTWDMAAAHAGDAPQSEGEPAIRTYVFSRTMQHLDRPGVELVTSNAGNFVRELKARPGKGICVMGGGQLASSLFDEGVIDEVGLNVHPVLLGSGIPMFAAAKTRTGLELLEARPIDGGCVLLNYRVKR